MRREVERSEISHRNKVKDEWAEINEWHNMKSTHENRSEKPKWHNMKNWEWIQDPGFSPTYNWVDVQVQVHASEKKNGGLDVSPGAHQFIHMDSSNHVLGPFDAFHSCLDKLQS